LAGLACNLPYVRREIARFSAVPEFRRPGPAFDARALRGKLVYSIPFTSDAPFLDIQDQLMKRIAEDIGMRFVVYRNKGQQSQWIQGMEQAITRGADAIILNGASPELLQPQIVKARRAGIPTIATHIYDVRDAQSPPGPFRAPNLAAVMPAAFTKIARLEVDWPILQTGCKANMLVLAFSDVNVHRQDVAAMRDEMRRYCGSGCKMTVISLPLVQHATRLQTAVQAALARDPGVNWIIPIVDFSAQFAVQAITATGKVGQIKIATFNGTPAVLKQIRDGDIVDMNIGENLEWLAHANLDQTMRVMVGLKPVPDEFTAQRIFSDANIGATGDPPTYNKGFGASFRRGYRQLWKLTP
jgi:ribose transport system substrate-binding protein